MVRMVQKLLLWLTVAGLISGVQAQDQRSSNQDPSLIVAGAIEGRRITITSADIAKLPRRSITVKDEQGTNTFEGVALHSVFEMTGVRFGKALAGDRLLGIVMVEGAPPSISELSRGGHVGEDYRAVFALPELDPSFTDTPVILATARDGKQLSGPEGPFRIVAAQDKRQSRWIRDVKMIWLLHADIFLSRQ